MSKIYNDMLQHKEAEIEAQRTKNTIDLGSAEDNLHEPVVKKQPTAINEDVVTAKQASRRNMFIGIALAGILLILILLSSGKDPNTTPPDSAQQTEKSQLSQQDQVSTETVGADSPDTTSTARSSILSKADIENELHQFLTNWQAAWQLSAGKDGDISSYLFFYSDDFKVGDFDKTKWMKNKERRNRNKEWIDVSISEVDFEIADDGSHATVRFNQAYKSPNYSDKSQKVLSLIKDETEWRIVSEISN